MPGAPLSPAWEKSAPGEMLSAHQSGSSDASADPMISEVQRAYLSQRRTGMATAGPRKMPHRSGLCHRLVGRPADVVANGKRFDQERERSPEHPHPVGVPKEHTVSLHERWQYAQAHGWDGLKRVSKTSLKNGWHRLLHAFLTWASEKGLFRRLRPSEIGRTRLEDLALIEGVWQCWEHVCFRVRARCLSATAMVDLGVAPLGWRGDRRLRDGRGTEAVIALLARAQSMVDHQA